MLNALEHYGPFFDFNNGRFRLKNHCILSIRREIKTQFEIFAANIEDILFIYFSMLVKIFLAVNYKKNYFFFRCYLF